MAWNIQYLQNQSTFNERQNLKDVSRERRNCKAGIITFFFCTSQKFRLSESLVTRAIGKDPNNAESNSPHANDISKDNRSSEKFRQN